MMILLLFFSEFSIQYVSCEFMRAFFFFFTKQIKFQPLFKIIAQECVPYIQWGQPNQFNVRLRKKITFVEWQKKNNKNNNLELLRIKKNENDHDEN